MSDERSIAARLHKADGSIGEIVIQTVGGVPPSRFDEYVAVGAQLIGASWRIREPVASDATVYDYELESVAVEPEEAEQDGAVRLGFSQSSFGPAGSFTVLESPESAESAENPDEGTTDAP